jgi:hypothetical protein
MPLVMLSILCLRVSSSAERHEILWQVRHRVISIARRTKQYDTRGPIEDLKHLMDSNPKLGFAFRTVVEKIKNGELTAEDIITKLSKRKS